MRKAYGGRAAAYEKKGEYDQALADYKMVVFSYAVELDAADTSSNAYSDLLGAAAKAYGTRAACFQAKGDVEAAQRDAKRAQKLQAKIKKDKSTEAAGRVTLRNDWTEPLTLVIAGVSYTLKIGESKTVPTPLGTFSYEMQAGPFRRTGTLVEGQTYSFGVPPGSAP
jgi:tetratricopeptide (TPR) repeat protein